MIYCYFEGVKTLFEDAETIRFWSQRNPCSLCRLGPCMCQGVTTTFHKIVSPKPQETPDGLLIRARTVAFFMRCERQRVGAHKFNPLSVDTEENWGDQWPQRYRVSIQGINPFGAGAEPQIFIDGKRATKRYT